LSVECTYFARGSAVLSCLFDRDLQVDHRQRVLVPNVDVALSSADRVGSDDHPLEHRVGVALHDRAVLKGTGISLVAVAQHEATIADRPLARTPLASGVEAGTATPSLARGGDLVDHFVRTHLIERLGEARVRPLRDRV
jgi:hypothetical protein